MKTNFQNEKKLPEISSTDANDPRFSITKDRLKLCSCIAILYMFLSILHIGCPIRFVTGISCPGCGMTRAVLSVLHLDFKDAFYYHPLFIITPFMLGLFLFEVYIKPIYYKIAWAIIFILFFTTYIIRLIFTHNSVVEIDIYNGLMLKSIYQLYVGGFK